MKTCKEPRNGTSKNTSKGTSGFLSLCREPAIERFAFKFYSIELKAQTFSKRKTQI